MFFLIALLSCFHLNVCCYLVSIFHLVNICCFGIPFQNQWIWRELAWQHRNVQQLNVIKLKMEETKKIHSQEMRSLMNGKIYIHQKLVWSCKFDGNIVKRWIMSQSQYRLSILFCSPLVCVASSKRCCWWITQERRNKSGVPHWHKGAFKRFLQHQKQNFPLDGQKSEEQTIWLCKHEEMRSGGNSRRLRLQSRIKVRTKFIRHLYLLVWGGS